MPVYSIGGEQLLPFLSSLMQKRELIAPVKRGPVSSFELLESPAGLKHIFLEALTSYSPKKFFFENGQVLYEYSWKGGKAHLREPAPQAGERVLFGVRACDSNALLVCDDVFLREKEDRHYKANRERTTVIGLQCSASCTYGFCDSVGHGEFREFDILFSDDGKEGYLVQTGSKRGEKLLEEFRKFFAPAAGAKPTKRGFRCSRDFSFEKIEMNKRNLAQSGRTCFSCQGCTTVCPTCTCFDVVDVLEPGAKGKRVRVWDSCLDPHFSMIAGICFRAERGERVEHFDLHKLRFHKKKFGRHMCTGCGRCIWVCLAGIDITKNVEPER